LVLKKIGLGGGCHWCTEGVFRSLKGISKVDQGWIKSIEEYDTFSEGVVVYYSENDISLGTIIEVHLQTHSSASNHSMRKKYRSAVYTYTDADRNRAEQIILDSSLNNVLPVVTKVLPFVAFKWNKEEYLDYYLKNKEKPFCKTYITPKIDQLKEKYSDHLL